MIPRRAARRSRAHPSVTIWSAGIPPSCVLRPSG
jgi:hypothetical protein